MHYTSLQRFWIENDLPNDHNQLIDYLNHIIEYGKDWKDGFILKYLNNYGILDFGVFSVLSYLRHHGTPTPILDWTRNPKIALFFATFYSNLAPSNNEIDNYFSLYELKPSHPFHLNDYKKISQMGFTQLEDSLRRTNNLSQEEDPDFIAKFSEAHFANKELFFDTIGKFPFFKLEDLPEDNVKLYINNNYNITNQEGLFIVNTDLREPLEKTIKIRTKELAAIKGDLTDDEINIKLNEHKENFISFEIHKNLKEYILYRLNNDSINLSFIYPDPKELAREYVKSFMTFPKI